MKIVFVITDYGSFNNFLGELAVLLTQRKHDVHVISSRDKVIDIADKYDYRRYGIQFYAIDFPRSFNLVNHYLVSRKIHHIINSIVPHVVSIHFTTGIFTSLLSARLRFRALGMFHGIGYPMIASRLKRQVFKLVEFFCANRLDEIWVLNRFDHDLLNRRYGAKLHLLPTKGLGCDLAVFDQKRFSGADRKQLKESLGIDVRDFVIAFTGRFVDFKGYGLTIKAYRLLEEMYGVRNVKLLTIGGRDAIHPTGLNEEEEAYLDKNVNIINIGFTKEVAKYLSIADLFVFPSKKEGIPVCIIEALAMEVPVVTLDARGCNDLIRDGENGFLVPIEGAAKDIAKAVMDMYNSSALREKLKENILSERSSLSRDRFVEQQMSWLTKEKDI